MTEKTRRFGEKVRNYCANIDAYNYSTIMRTAQNDTDFQGMVQDMTISRIAGQSALKKNKYKFNYRRMDLIYDD